MNQNQGHNKASKETYFNRSFESGAQFSYAHTRDGFKQLEDMECIPPKNLRDLFSQLPDPERFRKNLIKLLDTAKHLLVIYDEVMKSDQGQTESYSVSENQNFVGEIKYGDENKTRDLVVPAEKESKTYDQYDSKVNYAQYVNCKGDFSSTKARVEETQPNIPNLFFNTSENAQLENINHLPTKSNLNYRCAINPTYNMNVSSGKKMVSNIKLPYEDNNPFFHETFSQHKAGKEFIGNFRPQPSVLMETIQVYQQTYFSSNENEKSSDKNIKESEDVAGPSTNSVEKKDTLSTEFNIEDSDDNSEHEIIVYNDQLDLNQQTKYCRCNSYNKKKLNLKIFDTLIVPHNTPNEMEIDQPIARDKTGKLRKLKNVLTFATLKSKLPTTSSRSIQKARSLGTLSEKTLPVREEMVIKKEDLSQSNLSESSDKSSGANEQKDD